MRGLGEMEAARWQSGLSRTSQPGKATHSGKHQHAGVFTVVTVDERTVVLSSCR